MDQVCVSVCLIPGHSKVSSGWPKLEEHSRALSFVGVCGVCQLLCYTNYSLQSFVPRLPSFLCSACFCLSFLPLSSPSFPTPLFQASYLSHLNFFFFFFAFPKGCFLIAFSFSVTSVYFGRESDTPVGNDTPLAPTIPERMH